jgi:mitochondrial import receptor subunit TOM40
MEKSGAPTAFAPYLDSVASIFHPVASPIASTVNRFHGWKENMGLVQPGTVENITKEVSREQSRREVWAMY